MSAEDLFSKVENYKFAQGVQLILERWPALRLSVEQGWGGPESEDKREWLAGEIVYYCIESKTSAFGQVDVY